MNYQQAIAYLDDLQLFKIKLGLESVNALLDRFGRPQEAYPTIHLAGTNGKGSVGATLVSLFSHSGYKVGFYSSPHLQSVRERFTINTACISRKEFAALTAVIRQELEPQQVTYFEFTTALAFLWFQQQQVDLAVIETGLGGRLDATNVLHPLVSVITTISLDHQEHLGESLEQIAAEKAGIIKSDTPVICGAKEQPAQGIIQQTCDRLHSRCYTLQQDFTCTAQNKACFTYTGIHGKSISNLHPSLAGSHQQDNTCLALAAAEVVHDAGLPLDNAVIPQAIKQARWPGRLETIHHGHGANKRTYLLDGAHNEAGIEALLAALELQKQHTGLCLIWGSMADKQFGPNWHALLILAKRIILTQAEQRRSSTANRLLPLVPPRLRHKVTCTGDVSQALQLARETTQPENLILIAGSLYLVGAARHCLLVDHTAQGAEDGVL